MVFKPEDVDAAKVAEPIRAKAKENRKERTKANPRTTARKVVARKVDWTHSNVDFVMNMDIGREIVRTVWSIRLPTMLVATNLINFQFNLSKFNNLLKVEINNVLSLLPQQDIHHRVLQLQQFAGSMEFLRVQCHLQALQ